MGILKRTGTRTTVKRGKNAGQQGTIVGNSRLSGKRKVRTDSGELIKVRSRKLGRK